MIRQAHGKGGNGVPLSLPIFSTPGETEGESSADQNLPIFSCGTAAGMSDIVLIIKTGATEAQERLPVHFNTTMDCFPHVLFFSDYPETMDGHIIHDALNNVAEEIRSNHEDFELWRLLHEKGRANLSPDENNLADSSGPTGNQGNKAWRLDRFKNLPMLGKALELKPGAKWYIFTDADTFISWSNLLQWVEQLDHDKPIFAGSGATMAAAMRAGTDWPAQVFAHGGSGYLLSAPAMEAGAKLYAEKQEELDRFVLDHWYGDVALATVLEQHLDIKVSSAFPMIQGGDPTVMDFSEIGNDKKLWCFPAISYHHLAPTTMREIWEFEQHWISRQALPREPLRHGDVFKHWVLPKLASSDDSSPVRMDWDNHAEDVTDVEVGDMAACHVICKFDVTCMQYSYGDGVCKTSTGIKLGTAQESKTGMTSGWVMTHIAGFVEEFDQCDGGEEEGRWITLELH